MATGATSGGHCDQSTWRIQSGGMICRRLCTDVTMWTKGLLDKGFAYFAFWLHYNLRSSLGYVAWRPPGIHSEAPNPSSVPALCMGDPYRVQGEGIGGLPAEWPFRTILQATHNWAYTNCIRMTDFYKYDFVHFLLQQKS